MISGMLTRGKNCEDASVRSQVERSDGWRRRLSQADANRIIEKVGDFYIDCERMPSAADLKGHELEVIAG
jgi:hypothetical protein